MPIQLHASSTVERDSFLKLWENPNGKEDWIRPFCKGARRDFCSYRFCVHFVPHYPLFASDLCGVSAGTTT